MVDESLISQVAKLEHEGIVRDPAKFSFITQYPPPKTLPVIDSELIAKREGFELYTHIPFCTGKCGYCKFYSLVGQSEEVANDYIKAISSATSDTRRNVIGNISPLYNKTQRL